MSTRTAAIVIDNFLSDEKWDYIQNNISDYLNASEFIENRNSPYTDCVTWIKEKLKTFDFHNEQLIRIMYYHRHCLYPHLLSLYAVPW